MSHIARGKVSPKAQWSGIRVVLGLALKRCLPAWVAGVLLLAAQPLWAQAGAFQPTLTVGAGIQGSLHHSEPGSGKGVDDFTLDHARLYFNGDITKYIGAMFNTEYNSVANTMHILDAVGQFHVSPQFNVWFGRFLPPSDRANLYGPFYAHEWAVFTDGIQDGYPFVFQGRDNGVAYWGDFKAGTAKVKVSVGSFDGPSATPNSGLIWATRVQVDFWDPEDGYYLNGTYYGDKNLLAIGLANQVQSGRTATTADFLMERKVQGGGAFTIESEYSRYNRLGGYDANYARSQGGYGLVAFLFPKEVGVGKFEALGKFALAEFTAGLPVPPLILPNPSYRQKTTEVDLGYIIKQFDARILAYGKNTSFNHPTSTAFGIQKSFWEAGVGLQLQISKTIR